jgi:hypothetical protein
LASRMLGLVPVSDPPIQVRLGVLAVEPVGVG